MHSIKHSILNILKLKNCKAKRRLTNQRIRHTRRRSSIKGIRKGLREERRRRKMERERHLMERKWMITNRRREGSMWTQNKETRSLMVEEPQEINNDHPGKLYLLFN